MARLFSSSRNRSQDRHVGLTSISQTEKRIPRQHGSLLRWSSKAENASDCGGVGQSLRRSLASFICHRRGLLTYMAAWLLAWNPSLKQSIRRRMHSHAVCAAIQPISGLREGISFQITAAQISCTCDWTSRDHALANRLATAVGSIVDKAGLNSGLPMEFRSA